MLLEIAIPKEFVTETAAYDFKTEAPKLISKVKDLGTIIVLKDKQYYGIVDDRALTKSSVSKLQKTAIGKFAMKEPLLSESTSIETAMRYFYESNARALPFSQEGAIVGIVKREKLIELLVALHVLSGIKVGDIMVSPVIGIDAKANVAEAISAMQKNKINRLLVISNNKPAGIITNGDIAFTLASPAERLPEMKKEAHALDGIIVGSIAQPFFYTIDYNKSAEEAAKEMLDKGISSLAVTRNDKIVGLITARELFRAALSTFTSKVPVYVSGLDAYAKENEEDIKEALSKTAEKVAKFTKLTAKEVYANVKTKKSVYEISASIRFSKGNELHAKASNASLENTIKELTEKLYNMAKKKKEIMLTSKKNADRYYG
ncbi:MAG: CBS domain-containing protein [Candidatus Micrarchaeia archaeon]